MKKLLTISICTVLLLNCSTSRKNTRIIKAGVTHGPNHSFTLALKKFGEQLSKATGNRFQVQVYYSSQLGGEKEMQEMLTIGTLEMTVTGVLNTYEPMFAIFELPYLYRDRDHVLKVNSGPVMSEISSSLLLRGIRLIGFYENGFRNITNSVRPILSSQDVAGLKIRTPENPAQIETFKALGAIPTPLSYSELYAALLQGVVDGQENPLQNIWESRLYEVQKYIAITHHIYNSAYVLISERFWITISNNDRYEILQCIKKSSQWQLDLMENKDDEFEQKLTELGKIQFTYPDMEEFEKKCKPVYEVIFNRLGPKSREYVYRIINTF
ncbi:TRAP transporter substrate-binding protein [candidate division KSB1 bacterium]|nr:TRAP transporter substrate-binding protein [candidate division KSB1 bacterium]